MKWTKFLGFGFLLIGFLAAAQTQSSDIQIIQKPIQYGEKRKALSLEYLKVRHGLDQKEPNIVPRMIVLHYTAGGTAKSNINYFNNEEIENARTLNKNQSKLNVSSHFIVDRDGTIYQLMDETMFARHTIGLNYMAIGVENIGSKQNPLTQAQVEANIKLVRYLCEKFDIEYLIGHSEYTVFRNSKVWKESNPNYFTYKDDPGKSFMEKVRAGVQDLNLKEKP